MDQLTLLDAGPATTESKATRRRKRRFAPEVRRLAKRRSPIELMIDQSCGYTPKGGR